MNYTLQHKKNQEKDRLKSAVLTLLITLLVFLGIYFYRYTTVTEKPAEITTMLINFGDENNGASAEEPATEDGSATAQAVTAPPEVTTQPLPEIQEPVQPEPVQTPLKEKILTGKGKKTAVPKAEKTATKKDKKEIVKKPTAATTPAKSASSSTKNSASDGKGKAAIGNLIKGKGTKSGTQGTAGTTGNAGDPLGGAENGDSKIGVDRKLIAFIPGTMGRGGAQPAHNCTAAGTISISYTVDKAGNVTSAQRLSGTADACIAATSVSWVKKYVKAEKATTSSTGVYKISF